MGLGSARGRSATIGEVKLGLALGLGLLGLAALAHAGCASQCKDADADGRGQGCEQGPDCDDHDPSLGKDCGATARQCAAEPFLEGCPCLAGVARTCYSGAAPTTAIGLCRAGKQTCPTGAWSACEGEIAPHFEQCNGLDDDCDGIADEGVVSPCGGCNSSCTGGVWGPPAAPFEAQGELAVTTAGELTLALQPIESRTLWVPNTGEGTLSKVDAQSTREIARYRVAGATPERVAVDYDGDAWVLSPSLDGQSILTKVAGGEDRCRDVAGDGLQTSRDPAQLLALGEDECVLLRMPVGDVAEVARALAVDGTGAPELVPRGRIWVGMQAAERVVELDGESGALLREVATPGLSPFDALFDPWGSLWLIGRNGLLARIDPGADPPSVEVHEAPLDCYELDSLASDAQGILTLTGSSCEDVLRYEPARDRWQQLRTSSLLDARGVIVLGDNSWVTHTAGRISRVAPDPFAIEGTFTLASGAFAPLESIAIGADSFDKLWIVSSMGAPGGHGVLTRFDPATQSVTAQVALGRLPRAYGDISGERRLGVFAPEGSAQHVFSGCGVQRLDPSVPVLPQPTDWLRLHVASAAGVGASVTLEARRAADRSALPSTSWTLLGTLPQDTPPFPLVFEQGGVVEVRLTLRVSGRIGAPRVARVGLEWHCAGPT